MNVNEIEKVITKKTKAIIPVHLYGQSCEMDKIIKIAKKTHKGKFPKNPSMNLDKLNKILK